MARRGRTTSVVPQSTKHDLDDAVVSKEYRSLIEMEVEHHHKYHSSRKMEREHHNLEVKLAERWRALGITEQDHEEFIMLRDRGEMKSEKEVREWILDFLQSALEKQRNTANDWILSEKSGLVVPKNKRPTTTEEDDLSKNGKVQTRKDPAFATSSSIGETFDTSSKNIAGTSSKRAGGSDKTGSNQNSVTEPQDDLFAKSSPKSVYFLIAPSFSSFVNI